PRQVKQLAPGRSHPSAALPQHHREPYPSSSCSSRAIAGAELSPADMKKRPEPEQAIDQDRERSALPGNRSGPQGFAMLAPELSWLAVETGPVKAHLRAGAIRRITEQ